MLRSPNRNAASAACTADSADFIVSGFEDLDLLIRDDVQVVGSFDSRRNFKTSLLSDSIASPLCSLRFCNRPLALVPDR